MVALGNARTLYNGGGSLWRIVRTSSSQAPHSRGLQALFTRAFQSGHPEAPPTNVSDTTVPSFKLSEESLQSLKAPIAGFKLPSSSSATGASIDAAPKKIYARLSNSPKYAFKSDILAYFQGCDLQPHQLMTIFDEKYRQRFVQLEFDTMEAFRQAQRLIVRRGRLGGRYLKLDLDVKSDGDAVHETVKDFRGQSLLMMQLPTDVTAEDIERFFQGYNLAPYSTRFLRVPKDMNFKKINSNTPPVVERRALVKFGSPLEALRALRMKQGEFCLDRAIELRFVQ